MTKHTFTLNTPFLKATVEANLPIDQHVRPFRATAQLYRAYFVFATHQTLTAFKRPTKSTTVTK